MSCTAVVPVLNQMMIMMTPQSRASQCVIDGELR
jgi:hypothetical protein